MEHIEKHGSRKSFKPQCSEHNPEIGKWHGEWQKKSAEGYVKDRQGFIYSEKEAAGDRYTSQTLNQGLVFALGAGEPCVSRIHRMGGASDDPVDVSLSDLSVFRWPPGQERTMAVLTGYFDDSRTEGSVWTVAGFVGREREWRKFGIYWDAALKRSEAPYFHMKEMADPNGPFKKWRPPEEHQTEIAGFLNDLAQAIGLCGIKPIGFAIRLEDLDRFNAEHGLALDAYPLAVYVIMLTIGLNEPDKVVDLFFDRVEKVHSKLEKAETYANSDTAFPGATALVQPIPLQQGLTFRNVLPLQAADFAAWEIRKHSLQLKEWFDLPGKPRQNNEELRQFARQWSQSTYGQDRPPIRRSFIELMQRADFQATAVFDYHAICHANKLRGGVWS